MFLTLITNTTIFPNFLTSQFSNTYHRINTNFSATATAHIINSFIFFPNVPSYTMTSLNTFNILGVIILLSLMPNLAIDNALVSAKSNSMATCSDQSHCIDVAIEQSSSSMCSGSGSDCEWTVCLKIDLDNPSCKKDNLDTVSHSCIKESGICQVGGSTNFQMNTSEVLDIPNAHEQCQTGVGGDKLHFLLKDGAGCGKGSTAEYSNQSLPDGASVTCQARTDDVALTCSGNGENKECM